METFEWCKPHFVVKVFPRKDSKDSQSVPKRGQRMLPRNFFKGKPETEDLPEENLKGAFTPSVETPYVVKEPPVGTL